MALKGGFKNFANQTREIKDAPPIDLGSEAPVLHIVHEAAALHDGSKTRSTTQAATSPPAPEPASVESTGGAESEVAPKIESAPAKTASTPSVDEVKDPGVSGHTHYTELVRKELRLHAGQADELTLLASKVQRARKEKGERITDNTLIRVAVDLLLERQNELVGSTEDELRLALGLTPRA
ncbi:hypothetical protein GCM10023346_48560 [Arthrobacter gyeryongensis]|uniref:Uncharacterized protein n=1 Tax=Arthrobacter gyeryongensis TaxID=1650592 RepID=A0ABP9SSX5_9MICC